MKLIDDLLRRLRLLDERAVLRGRRPRGAFLFGGILLLTGAILGFALGLAAGIAATAFGREATGDRLETIGGVEYLIPAELDALRFDQVDLSLRLSLRPTEAGVGLPAPASASWASIGGKCEAFISVPSGALPPRCTADVDEAARIPDARAPSLVPYRLIEARYGKPLQGQWRCPARNERFFLNELVLRKACAAADPLLGGVSCEPTLEESFDLCAGYPTTATSRLLYQRYLPSPVTPSPTPSPPPSPSPSPSPPGDLVGHAGCVGDAAYVIARPPPAGGEVTIRFRPGLASTGEIRTELVYRGKVLEVPCDGAPVAIEAGQ